MTYVDVPWNGPWYARHGYAVLDPLPDHLLPLRATEERFRMGGTAGGSPWCGSRTPENRVSEHPFRGFHAAANG